MKKRLSVLVILAALGILVATLFAGTASATSSNQLIVYGNYGQNGIQAHPNSVFTSVVYVQNTSWCDVTAEFKGFEQPWSPNVNVAMLPGYFQIPHTSKVPVFVAVAFGPGQTGTTTVVASPEVISTGTCYPH